MKDKVVLTYKDLDGSFSEEIIWVVKLDDNFYKVNNIPFYAGNLALGDIISVEDDQGILYFDELIAVSGNSTVQIIFFDIKQSKNVIEDLEQLNCKWESMKEQPYFAVDIPESVDYQKVKDLLDIYVERGCLDYKEACISEHHFANLR
ncbi:DUF4265 domain-containing protein [Sphingobacterium olei]|uniref:DUF4265 domain-containing protein n=1 Tax=Sphingobacterium olei TaxID=2571155 RepID=A0A4U0N7Y3_9SPHI|nr:DUF4265 domain-containing protein [Sphingobacterium olei]TJZ49885.1 DUF4265 domain-containing protein [Sphingobacterium olei]